MEQMTERERTGPERADAFMPVVLAGGVRPNQACRSRTHVGVRVATPKLALEASR